MSELLQRTFKGVKYLVLLQLVSRITTFTLNLLLYRLSLPKTIGTVSIFFELILSSVLFLTREPMRLAFLRLEPLDQIKQTSKKDWDKAKWFSSLVNGSFIPFCMGGILSSIIYCYYTMVSPLSMYTHQALIMYLCASMIELLSEPFFTLLQNQLNYTMCTAIEGLAVLVKSCVTVGCILYTQQESQAVVAFGCGQIMYSATLCLGWAFYFLFWRRYSIRAFSPKQLSFNGKNVFIHPDTKSLAYDFMLQTWLKHLLTEGDKFLLLLLNVPQQDQGAYAFAHNLGSLVARILFFPLEETMRQYFSKSLAKGLEDSKKTCWNVLSLLMRFHLFLGGLFICLGTNYTKTLVHAIGGSKWSDQPVVMQVLTLYCWYVPIMGLNGVSEAFVSSVAPSKVLEQQRYIMIMGSLIFVFTSWFTVVFLGWQSSGFVIANCVNLAIRTVFCHWFIKCYFGQWNYPRIHLRVVLSFLVAHGITHMSKYYLSQHPVKHVAVGLVMAMVILYTMQVRIIHGLIIDFIMRKKASTKYKVFSKRKNRWCNVYIFW